MTKKIDTFTIRGITFNKTGKIRLDNLPAIYLVIRALEGDMLAEALLNMAEIVIINSDGEQIYPPLIPPK